MARGDTARARGRFVHQTVRPQGSHRAVRRRTRGGGLPIGWLWLMDPTAFLIRSLLFPAWVRKNGSRRLVYARELAKTERLSSDALRELQWVQLKAILQHAFDQCAFYRKKWTDAGVSPGDVESLDDINRIPTLTKAEIQESLSELVADNYRPRPLIRDLTGEGRALIESTFGCAVFDRYGCREFAVIASECDRHQGLHVNAENLLLEVLQDPAAAPDSGGEIVITDLKNYAMPLIRYRSRDVGYLTSSRCDCGRGLPLLELRGGRTTDLLTALNGQKVSGIVLATYGITNIDGLRQVQFIQERRDAVRARIVRGPGWSQEALDTLIAKVR